MPSRSRQTDCERTVRREFKNSSGRFPGCSRLNLVACFVAIGPSVLSIILSCVSANAAQPASLSIRKSTKAVPITHDVAVVAWVDASAIQSPDPASVNSDLRTALTVLAGDFTNCLLTLDSWSNGQRVLISSDTDRIFANAFLLSHSGNARPGSTLDPKPFAESGDYRLFNRAKVEFSVKNGLIFGAPRFVAVDLPLVGRTPNPCTALPLFGPVDGQTDTTNNGQRNKTTNQLVVYQLNEGRIGDDGQRVNRTLNKCNQFDCTQIAADQATPWIWNTITFDISGSVRPLDHQIFPAYSIYVDGLRTSEISQPDFGPFIGLDTLSRRSKDAIP